MTSPLRPDILDAHIHLWDPRSTPRAVTPFVWALGAHPAALRRVARLLVPRPVQDFLGDPRFVLNPFLPADYRALAGPRVGLYVHVEAGYVPVHKLGLAGESHWLASLRDPPWGVVGAVDLTSPKLGALLDTHHRENRRFRGVRDKLAHASAPGVMDWAPAKRSQKPAFRRGYALLGERGLSFDAFIYSTQLGELAQLAEAHPETPLVLCHMGTPVALEGPFGGCGETAAERADIAARWRDGLLRLASLPHVHVKLSGMLMPVIGFGFHQRPESPSADELYERLGPHARFVLDAFGPERCMFGSNFPMDAVSAPYGAWVATLERIMRDAQLDATAKQAVLFDNARRFYRL